MKKIFLLPLVPVLLFINGLNAQTEIRIGPTAGISIPAGDYSGSTIDFYSGSKYGQGSGATIGATAKLKAPFISLKGAVLYTLFKNTGYYEYGKGNIEVKHTVITASAGPEAAYRIPMTSVTPFIGAELLFSFFSGKTSFNNVSNITSGTYDLNSAVRTGISLSAGAEFESDGYVINLELKYNLHNIFGTKFTQVSDPQRLDSYLSLNDKKDPLYNGTDTKHPIGKDRMISSISITAAVHFKLGI